MKKRMKVMKYLVAFILCLLIVPVVHGKTGGKPDVVVEACLAMKKYIAYLSCVEKRAERCLPVGQELMSNPLMIELGETAILCTFDIADYCIPGEDMNMCRSRHHLEVTKCIKELVKSARERLCSEPKIRFAEQTI